MDHVFIGMKPLFGTLYAVSSTVLMPQLYFGSDRDSTGIWVAFSRQGLYCWIIGRFSFFLFDSLASLHQEEYAAMHLTGKTDRHRGG